jgi:putative transposase
MDIRRYYYPGQIAFITQIVKDRKSKFSNPKMVALLKETLRNVQILHPFSMLAYVFLPDHFHLLIRPEEQTNFSQIMHSLKLNFTKAYKQAINYSGTLNFWQKRFWDHIIRDEIDLENHIHYIHFNPIKHGYVNDISSWPDSSYSVWEERGLYDPHLMWKEPKNSSWGE